MLFIHPLLLLRKKSPGDQSSSLKRVVTMATRSMATCALSDMLALSLVHLVFPKNSPRSVNSAVYDFSLVVNTVSILLTFGDFPIFCSSNQKASCWENDVEMAEKEKPDSGSGENPEAMHTLMSES